MANASSHGDKSRESETELMVLKSEANLERERPSFAIKDTTSQPVARKHAQARLRQREEAKALSHPDLPPIFSNPEVLPYPAH